MRFPIIVVVPVAGLIAIAVGWIYQSSSTNLTIRPALEIPADIDYFMTNFSYRSIDQAGDLDYQIKSRYLEHYTKEDISRIEEPVVLAYQQDDDWRVEAKVGEMYHESNTMLLSGDVVLQKLGDDPMKMKSKSILFDPERDLVVADQYLEIETPNAHISAQQGMFDMHNQVYKLNQTKAIYYDEKS